MFHDKHTLKSVASMFDAAGEFVSASPYGSGHINNTYLVELQSFAFPL